MADNDKHRGHITLWCHNANRRADNCEVKFGNDTKQSRFLETLVARPQTPSQSPYIADEQGKTNCVGGTLEKVNNLF